MASPFEIINVISNTKKLKEDIDFEASYIPFLINKGLSLYPDTIYFVNEMNMNHHLPKKLQFDYLNGSILSRKRYTKWPKKIAEDDNLEMVKQYFGYNNEKAKSTLKLLNEQQLKTIQETFIKGGRNDK